MSEKAEISVITIFRNEEKHIEETIHSLLHQDFQNFECILVDGHSEDRSYEIAESLIRGDARFHLIRQISYGISNAFNEGLAASEADYLMFLNAGDSLSDAQSLGKAASLCRLHSGEIIAFRSEYMNESGKLMGKFFPEHTPCFEKLPWYCSLSHQATLVPAEFFRKTGGYLPVMKIAMDYELWLRAMKSGYRLHASDVVIAHHRIGGVSFSQLSLSRKEVILARIFHLGFFRLSLLKDLVQLFLIFWGTIRESRQGRASVVSGDI
ncbi:MAG: glycosyltransferase [Deltaproteobacteria bacterium]|nr:glycosyltransferase [Deltaproteobacteria bacterium]